MVVASHVVPVLGARILRNLNRHGQVLSACDSTSDRSLECNVCPRGKFRGSGVRRRECARRNLPSPVEPIAFRYQMCATNYAQRWLRKDTDDSLQALEDTTAKRRGLLMTCAQLPAPLVKAGEESLLECRPAVGKYNDLLGARTVDDCKFCPPGYVFFRATDALIRVFVDLVAMALPLV